MPDLGDIDDTDEFGGARHTRHISNLSVEEWQALKNIKSPQDIQSCHIVGDWVDDHIICIGVVLNGIEFGAWWCGWEIAGAFKYWEHPEAKQDIVRWLTSDMGDAEGPELDEITPEDLPQEHQQRSTHISEDLDDKDEFGFSHMKDAIWHNITSMASGDTAYQRNNNRTWWARLADALEELAGEARMIADRTTEEPIFGKYVTDPDEITPEDLPQ